MAYTSPNAGAFYPVGNTVTFLANTAAPTAVQCTITQSPNTGYNSFCQYRIFNSGSSLIFLGVGANATVANTNATVVSTSNTGVPVLPGTLEIFSFPTNSYFTAITSSGTSQVYISPGFGV
jgi:hypothetical protein